MALLGTHIRSIGAGRSGSEGVMREAFMAQLAEYADGGCDVFL